MTRTTTLAVHSLADEFADRLATPPTLSGALPRWWPQSLAHGGAGIALLHIERAATGRADWSPARAWLRFVTSGDLSVGSNASLYFGAPAAEFVLRAAAPYLPGLASRTLPELERATDGITHRRLKAARHRLRRRDRPPLAEFDGIRGLAGLGTILMGRSDPAASPLGDVLTYLVALTEPISDGDGMLPGWWTDLAPSGKPSKQFPGGHANTGMAHGIGGVLALLALALRRGIIVDGQVEAITRVLAWLDRWQRGGTAGSWWPYWITREELRTGQVIENTPRRPSWCYGTLGLARAQQLAALAMNTPIRQAMAEAAAVAAVTDPKQLRQTEDASLCHGYAGLVHIAGLIAADSPQPGALTHAIPHLIDELAHTLDEHRGRTDPSWLEGYAGTALVLHALAIRPATGWDRALLAT